MRKSIDPDRARDCSKATPRTRHHTLSCQAPNAARHAHTLHRITLSSTPSTFSSHRGHQQSQPAVAKPLNLLNPVVVAARIRTRVRVPAATLQPRREEMADVNATGQRVGQRAIAQTSRHSKHGVQAKPQSRTDSGHPQTGNPGIWRNTSGTAHTRSLQWCCMHNAISQ